MTYPTSIRNTQSMIKRYNKKTNILSAFDHLSKFLKELIESTQNGQKPHGEYEEVYQQYVIGLEINSKTIEIIIRDTNVYNSLHQAFAIVVLDYDYIKREIIRNRFEIPYVSYWDDKFYRCSLDSFKKGAELLQLINELSIELGQKKRMAIPRSVNSEKEKMMNEIQYHKERGDILFAEEPLSQPFRKLMASLIHVAEHIEEIHSVENQYQIQRMVFGELRDIITLFEKVYQQGEWVETHQFVDIFNGMRDFIYGCKSSPFTDTKRELEKQTKILNERYIRKQVQI